MEKIKILSIGIIALFIFMAFIPIGTSISTTVLEKQDDSSVLSEPDYKFDKVTVELHGKCTGWSVPDPDSSYSRWINIPILFTDYELVLTYCFKDFLKGRTPGMRYKLVEGYFDVTTPNGETIKVQYDGDTRIDYVSCRVIESRYDYETPHYYVKGTLYQGVEIYL